MFLFLFFIAEINTSCNIRCINVLCVYIMLIALVVWIFPWDLQTLYTAVFTNHSLCHFSPLSSHVSKMKWKMGNLLWWSSWQNKQQTTLHLTLKWVNSNMELVKGNRLICLSLSLLSCSNYLIILPSHGLQVGTRTLRPPQQVQVVSQCTFTW